MNTSVGQFQNSHKRNWIEAIEMWFLTRMQRMSWMKRIQIKQYNEMKTQQDQL